MAPNAVITGWGMYAPSHVMTNDDLAKLVDTSDEWIVSRTGIHERRIAADDENTTSLSVHAARDALAVAGVDASADRKSTRLNSSHTMTSRMPSSA